MALAAKLDVWQNDLIDMSRSNTLLYFRSSGRGAGVHLLLPHPDQLYLSVACGTKNIALDKIPTGLDPDDLERALARLRSRARDDHNDRGINTLFLAFGILNWKEAESSSEAVQSPLILVPVSLARQGTYGAFSVERLDDEEIAVNPTLRAKLEHDFKVRLPSFADIEAETDTRAGASGPGTRIGSTRNSKTSLSLALGAIKRALPEGVEWTIVPEVNLGRFFFQKLAMYEDLAHHREQVLQHSVLLSLGGERGMPRIRDLVSASELDERLPPAQVFEILDADSSQQEAIVAAKDGASFVLQGPPGTGKSQTIANIIAESFAQGKRVLFVSEKMAALEVVRERLRSAGLDKFCLDLHDPRTSKALFIRNLENSITDAEQRPARNDHARWERESEKLKQTRAELNDYVRQLHAPRFALNESAFEVYGKLAELDGIPDRDFAIPDVEHATQIQITRMCQSLERLNDYRDVLDRYTTFPWRQTLLSKYSLELGSAVRDHFGRLLADMERLQGHMFFLSEALGEMAEPQTFAWADLALGRVTNILTSPLPPRHWLRPDMPAKIQAIVTGAAANDAAYRTHKLQLAGLYDPGITQIDHAAILKALTDDASWAMRSLRSDAQEPHDASISRRTQLDSLLRRAQGVLTALTSVAPSLAEVCCTSVPQSPRDISDLLQLAQCLLTTPNPPTTWLNANRFDSVRFIVEDAIDRYTACSGSAASLEAVYESTYFTLDLPAISQRFRDRYQSLIRYITPQFYRDVKVLRTHLKPGITRSVAELDSDLQKAVRLLAEKAYLRDHRIEHAQALDQWFDGENTNWGMVGDALRWARQYHACIKVTPVSTEITDVVTSRMKGLGAIRAHSEEITPLYDRWRHVQVQLAQHLYPQRLVVDAASFDESNIEALLGSLQHLHVELSRFWAALDIVLSHRVEADHGTEMPPAINWSAICEEMHVAAAIAGHERWIDSEASALSRTLGHFFALHDTDWTAVQAALNWSTKFVGLYAPNQLPESVVELACYEGDSAQREALGLVLVHARETLESARSELQFSDTVLPRKALLPTAARSFELTPVAAVRERIAFLLENVPCLERWLACQECVQECRALGLDGVISDVLRSASLPPEIVEIALRRFYSLWLDKVRDSCPVLAGFQGIAQARLIARFRELDERHTLLAQNQLNVYLTQQRVKCFASVENDPYAPKSRAVAELKRQVKLKRHRSIRYIVRNIAPALLDLMPCWMMSPLSVSQFVESGQPLFDLVIFDEASQVCAEDAICAILRGRQLIVVGDSKQLPPSRFFTRGLADDEQDEDDDAGAQGTANERVESILDECAGAGFAQRSLLWHYRSRHESLIAFSNHHFYRDRLITFPSPATRHSEGVAFDYVADGVYDRRNTRTNRREAERVADLIFEHMRTTPERSLGVVALSRAQQEAIRDVIETRFKSRPDLAAYAELLDEFGDHGFFIKNLESVQGDERDVIILSVGYGPDVNGIVHKQFGPVIRQGGERRLNVAVTRARYQTIVVTSMRSTNLPADSTNAGVRTLHDFLEYAENGPSTLRSQTPSSDARSGTANAVPQFDSPFERAVYSALQAKGLDLATQVGCSDYRIDLAVRDQRDPAKFVLGIECDGRTYHSSHTARDRDRLRQRHLEQMGWTIHRIWSSDWISNPAGEVAKVLAKLESITQGGHPTPEDALAPEPEADSADDEVDEDAHSAVSIAQVPPVSAILPGPTPSGVVAPPYVASAPSAGVNSSAIANARQRLDAIRARRISQASTRHEESKDTSKHIDLLIFLQAKHATIIDKRPSGGSLWVLDEPNTALIVQELRTHGFRFSYARNGGSATRNRPAWYLHVDAPPQGNMATKQPSRPNLQANGQSPHPQPSQDPNTCETCSHFMPQTEVRFQCGWDGTIKRRVLSGGTPGCQAWSLRDKRQHS